MQNFLIIFIFLTTLLGANHPTKICLSDMNGMIHSYHAAEKLEYKKEYSLAIDKLNKSNAYANAALQSCKDDPKYDFNVVYGYIVTGENRRYSIYEAINEK